MVVYIVSLDIEFARLMTLGLVKVSEHIEMMIVSLVEVRAEVQHLIPLSSRDRCNDCMSST